MSFVSRNNFVINVFSNCGEKLVKSIWYIVLGLVSIWLFIFGDVICLFDLILTLIRDLTASQVCLEFVELSNSICHTFVSFKF